MKIRNGFVSNSSSSSFIVKENNIITAFKKVYAHWIKSMSEWHNQSTRQYIDSHLYEVRIIDNFIEKYEMEGLECGIVFPLTINYPTFLYADVNDSSKIYVETCNNNGFDNSTLNIIEYFGENMGGEIEGFLKYDDNVRLFINVIDGKTYTKIGFDREETSMYSNYEATKTIAESEVECVVIVDGQTRIMMLGVGAILDLVKGGAKVYKQVKYEVF